MHSAAIPLTDLAQAHAATPAWLFPRTLPPKPLQTRPGQHSALPGRRETGVLPCVAGDHQDFSFSAAATVY